MNQGIPKRRGGKVLAVWSCWDRDFAIWASGNVPAFPSQDFLALLAGRNTIDSCGPRLQGSFGFPGPKSKKKAISERVPKTLGVSAEKSAKYCRKSKYDPKALFFRLWGLFLTFWGIFGDFLAEPPKRPPFETFRVSGLEGAETPVHGSSDRKSTPKFPQYK